ncbi:MAG TPA: ACT domain-containing protein [Firmicutes bacterium]|nr:ACT domain-containing protein [Candidatus Fermentithermobacillaceae bacterium]
MIAIAFQAGLYFVLIGRVFLGGVLAAVLGLEREIRNKDAGLRTYTLVGLGSALIMVVSKHGFLSVLGPNVDVDPARVAAQVVSGIGFLGGGLIFVKRDAVRGLTTAAGLWLCSGIGLAAGAGMVYLAVFAAAAGLVTMVGLDLVERKILRSKRDTVSLEVVCYDEKGVLAKVSTVIANAGFNIEAVEIRKEPGEGLVTIYFALTDSADIQPLVVQLAEEDVVVEVFPGGQRQGRKSPRKGG